MSHYMELENVSFVDYLTIYNTTSNHNEGGVSSFVWYYVQFTRFSAILRNWGRG